MAKAITAPQRAYLAAFDRWLRMLDGPERDKAADAKRELLSLMRLDPAERPAKRPPRAAPKHVFARGLGAHVRWHENRGISAASCAWCEAD